jgi:hypothetical protein
MCRNWIQAIVVFTWIGTAASARAQVFVNKETGARNQALVDSLAHSTYPYTLPIWGDRATHRGFNLPYSAGVSVQYFGQRSDLVIENLMVGFNDGPMHDLDNIVRFDKAKSSSDGISIRPDIWLFPFLDVYGILGRSTASTHVGYSLWLPDSSGHEHRVVALSTKVEFAATTFGFGLTPTMGVGGNWLALDMNFTWTDVPQLKEPASAFVFDPRLGKAFRLRTPDENINLWVGAFRLEINTGTEGSVPLADALPIDQWQGSVSQGIHEIARLDAEVEAWWNGLSPAEQANPVNRARYDATKATLARAGAFLESANQALSDAGSATVNYSLDKRPADPWNFTLGGQYQLSKTWMFRAELGFLGSRTHVILGAQYRFGL